MGWFWQSPPRSPVEGKPAPPPFSTTSSPSQPPPKQQDNTDMDPEIAKFLELFQADLNGNKASEQPSTPEGEHKKPTTAPPPADPKASPSSSPSSSSPSSWLSWRSAPTPAQAPSSSNRSARTEVASAAVATTATADREDGGREDIAAAILPTNMSCRQAFDHAWHCNSVGGQWNAVYRYGAVRQCSELWDDFWFCMRVRSHSPQLKEEAIRERYREKEERKYGADRPSSEDVWRSRNRRVEPGTAFSQPVEVEPGLDDAEWRRENAERRRGIREGLGFEGRSGEADTAGVD